MNITDEMVRAARGKLPANIEDSFAGADYAEGFNGAMALVREELHGALEAALSAALAAQEDQVLVPRQLLADIQLISEGVLPDGDGVDVSTGLWAEGWIRRWPESAGGGE